MAPPNNSLVDYKTESKSTSGQTDENQDEVVIAVMGSTGTGKSSFIRLLTGDETVKVGNNLESETSDVQVIRFRDRTSGRNVTIVDTPGFDDSREGITDTDILKKIAEFLLKQYDQDKKLNGLIYVTRISDPRFGGQAGRNLRMFRNLCGTKTYKNVVILTTFWDRISSKEEGVGREEQMKSKLFKDLVEGGGRFMRYDRSLECTHQVLGHILTLAPATVQITEEIRVQGKRLEDTAAGSVRREEVNHIIAKHKEEVAELKAEIKAIKDINDAERRELEKEQAKLLQSLAQWERERSELKKGLDEERKSRERLEAEAAKEKENHVQWRNDQERKWTSQLDAQGQKRNEALQKLQAELYQEKEARKNVEQAQERRQADESAKEAVKRALQAERDKSYKQKGLELAEEIPLVPNFIAKPYLGVLGFGLDTTRSLFGNPRERS